MDYYEERAQKEKEIERLQKMSMEQLRDEYDARMKDMLIAEIQKLPERIDAHLDSCVHKIITVTLGVKHGHWHDSEWEIDDRSKASALARELGEHVLKQVKMAIPDFIKSLVVGDPRIPPIKTAYTKAYKQHLADLINSKTWEVAKTNAEKRFIEIMEEIGQRPLKKALVEDRLRKVSDDDETTGSEEDEVPEGTEGPEGEEKEG